jgi:prephenate dehydrogenase (NADP+)
MGTAWAANKQFPWEVPRYIGGIENVKMNITLRIFANKWHVYAGLAILNPAAQTQIKQYAESVTELFKLMLAGHRDELRNRIHTARRAVFGDDASKPRELLLRDEVLDRFSLGEIPETRLKNNHLSLLAIVDCWWKLGIVPYDHMICSTPVRCSQLIAPTFSRWNEGEVEGRCLTDTCSSSACGSASQSICTATTPYLKNASTRQ